MQEHPYSIHILPDERNVGDFVVVLRFNDNPEPTIYYFIAGRWHSGGFISRTTVASVTGCSTEYWEGVEEGMRSAAYWARRSIEDRIYVFRPV